mmetsp:Transcript_6932/g.12665  ORF Transcript_6932/g.12665 Transcript_6932/m.12665 type:complete len:264 (+) Transcript_6932:65-856(+)
MTKTFLPKVVSALPCILAFMALLIQTSYSFSSTTTGRCLEISIGRKRHRSSVLSRSRSVSSRGSSSAFTVDQMNSDARPAGLFMYNLPPSGGGGGGNNIGGIVRGAVAIALIIAFFASPLGGLFLGLVNSFFIFLFIFPLVASVGYQIWQSLNTISGTCPNCGAPATVLKTNNDGFASPSLCLNCGAVLQANRDNTGIDNISGKNAIDDLSSQPMGGNSLFDIFTTTTTTTSSTSTGSDGRSKRRRETTIIDVDVEDDDKPFQ